MKYYGQNQEDKIICDLFDNEISKHYGKDFVGSLLSIGENNGQVYSNALALIERRFKAILVEPSPIAFNKLRELHKDRENVYCYQVAISDFDGTAEFYDSGTHLHVGDTGLLSTLDKKETERWGNTTEFNAIEVQVQTFASFMVGKPFGVFDFISIDAESKDLCILKQIDFIKTKTCVVCVEWNGKDFYEYDSYMKSKGFGFELIHKNAENLIYYRQHRKKEGI